MAIIKPMGNTNRLITLQKPNHVLLTHDLKEDVEAGSSDL